MKKILAVLIAVSMLMCTFAFAACGDESAGKISVSITVPDGAPALAVAKLINDDENFGIKVKYKVVNASDIKNFVVGSGEKSDIALVPVNLASLLLGSGNEYKGVATVTHGNLYLLSKDDTVITAENFDIIKGKTVAVVNIANVPGLTFKAAVQKAGLQFTEDEKEKTDENVLLTGINGTDIATTLNQGKADYVLAPEPAVSTITGKVPAIKKVAALHDIYGSYPQAVMVVKAAFLAEHEDIVKKVFDAMTANESWIIENPAAAAKAVASKLSEGATASFTAENTTEASVRGCNIKMIRFTEKEIETVKNYITDIKAFGGTSPVAKDFSDNFFVELGK